MSLISNAHTVSIITPPTTALGLAAQSLAVGQFAALTGTTGLTAAGAPFNTSGIGSITEYCDKGCWDPIRKRARFIGDSHTPAASHMVEYDDATNSWYQIAVPWSGIVSHGYHHSALDTTTGDSYWYQYFSTTVRKFTASTGTWSTIAAIPMSGQNICSPMEYFPNRHSLVTYEANTGLYEYNITAGTWSHPFGAQSAFTSYNNQSKYDALRGCIVIVGPTSTDTGYRYNSDGTLTTISTGNVGFKVPEDGSGAILTQDPVSGKVIAFSWGRAGYEFNGSTFVATGVTFPTAACVTSNILAELVAVPVSTYGVVMFAGSSGTVGKAYIYRHS